MSQEDKVFNTSFALSLWNQYICRYYMCFHLYLFLKCFLNLEISCHCGCWSTVEWSVFVKLCSAFEGHWNCGQYEKHLWHFRLSIDSYLCCFLHILCMLYSFYSRQKLLFRFLYNDFRNISLVFSCVQYCFFYKCCHTSCVFCLGTFTLFLVASFKRKFLFTRLIFVAFSFCLLCQFKVFVPCLSLVFLRVLFFASECKRCNKSTINNTK